MLKSNKRESSDPVKSIRLDSDSLRFIAKFQKKTGLDFSNAVRLMLRKVAEFHGWA